MKQLKKNLTMYICIFVAVFCAMTLRAEAGNVRTDTLGDNDGITWTYDEDTKTLTITGEDSGLNGYYSGSKFVSLCEDVEIIRLEDCTLKGEIDHMFCQLKSLKKVEHENLDISEVTNMSSMFWGCSALESVDLNGLDTSGVTDMSNMFEDCTSLVNMDLSGLDTTSVTNMGGMFVDCTALKSVDMSGLNTSHVTNMISMFNGCSALESLKLDGIDTSNVTNMGWMFFECAALIDLDVSNFNTTNVLDMKNMFDGCSALKSLDFSDFDTAKVTTMYRMFGDCSSLKTLNINSFDTGNVQDMSQMFKGCSGLESLTLGNLDTSSVINMHQMFMNCSRLTDLDVSSFDTSNVMYMFEMFSGCSGLEELDLSSFGMNSASTVWGMFKGCTGLKSLDLRGLDFSKELYFGDMLKDCNSLEIIYTMKSMANENKIELPGTFIAPEQRRTTVMNNDFCNTTLVNVNKVVTSLSVTPTFMELKPGDVKSLQVTIAPNSAVLKEVSWSSSDTAVVTVDATGKVTAVGSGKATITATTKDGTCISASCSVEVWTEQERQIRAFVSRMYTVALDRAAEADGLDFYTERLLSGDSNGACLAESFLCSPEFLNKGYDDAQYVKVLYRTFFDREPAAEEVSYWAGKLASGQTRAFVLSGFVNSVEFDNLCASYGISRGFMREDGKPLNPGIGRFAERLYTVVLERAGEKEGIEFWSLNIANGTCTPKDAAKNFFLSQEYVNKNTSDAKYITTLYKAFMDREPEDGGVEYWQNVLKNGATREQILEGFADSAEFQGIMASFGL